MSNSKLALFWASAVGIGLLTILIGLGLNALFPIVGRWVGACLFIAVLGIPAWFLILHIYESLESSEPRDT